jgi:hypothetical protein
MEEGKALPGHLICLTKRKGRKQRERGQGQTKILRKIKIAAARVNTTFDLSVTWFFLVLR